MAYWTTNYYDSDNRVTSISRPASASDPTLQSILIDYTGRTTTITDRQGMKSTRVTTVAGTFAAGTANGFGNAATFNNPKGITVINGLVFVADNAGQTIRMLRTVSGASD